MRRLLLAVGLALAGIAAAASFSGSDETGTVAIQETFQGAIVIQGALGVDSGITTAALDVAGNSQLRGTLIVDGGTTLTGFTSTRNSAVFGALGVDGGITTASLDVAGNSQLRGTLIVDGGTTVSGFTATQNSAVLGALGVDGGITTASLDVAGNSQLRGTLIVDGGTTVSGFTATQAAHIFGTLNTDGGITAPQILLGSVSANSLWRENANGFIETPGRVSVASIIVGANDLQDTNGTSRLKVPASSFATLQGTTADGASNIGVKINNAVTLSTTAAIADFENNGTPKLTVFQDGSLKSTSTALRGTITMSSGTGTATVLSGAICVCSVTSAFLACEATVSTTTLTVTVTAGGSNTVSYICIQ